jgi:hypothetical protein
MKTTVAKVIAKLDKLKPNAYDNPTKLSWINEVEERIYQDIILRKKVAEDEVEEVFTVFTDATDDERELVVESPYLDVYFQYLSSKVDYHNQDFGLYNNSTSIFNKTLQDYAAYYRRNNRAKDCPQPSYEY